MLSEIIHLIWNWHLIITTSSLLLSVVTKMTSLQHWMNDNKWTEMQALEIYIMTWKTCPVFWSTEISNDYITNLHTHIFCARLLKFITKYWCQTWIHIICTKLYFMFTKLYVQMFCGSNKLGIMRHKISLAA